MEVAHPERTVAELIVDGDPSPELIPKLRAAFKTGIHSFFDVNTGAVREPCRGDSAGFLFSEVTGYALIELVEQWEACGDEKFMEKALKAADRCGGDEGCAGRGGRRL